MAVVRRQVLVQLTQVQELVYAAEKVVCRDVVFEVEGVEQGRLPGFLTSHHRCDFRWIDGKSVDQLQPVDSTEFFNGIGRKQKSLHSVAGPRSAPAAGSVSTMMNAQSHPRPSAVKIRLLNEECGSAHQGLE